MTQLPTPNLTCSRKFSFDAGHRVLRHESKCAHLHGHNYHAEVSVAGPKLDDLGRVIDFSVLKEKIGWWIDHNWDHNFLCHPDDPLVKLWRDTDYEFHTELFGGKPPYIFPEGTNPTAENIAIALFEHAQELLTLDHLQVTHVRIWETLNCFADYYGPHPDNKDSDLLNDLIQRRV